MADGSLCTERLVLRPPSMNDLDWCLVAINTPGMMRHLGGKVRSESEVRESLEGEIGAFGDPGGHRRWTVWHGEERVGRVGLFHVRSEAAPERLRGQREIGWMFAEAHQGRGFSTEAARAVLDWAFCCGIGEAFSQTSDSNRASTRMMHRLGLGRRAELDYVDPEYPAADNPTTVWSVTARDWSVRNG
ncbi:GNAT family N-acetyltransferase [Tsuneonella amylolytica]|uniref:GNAT family N-acetyltransferase n=1 Tax=Tsuneonella amylolytica TaxID=2338327 RepID=UPI000EAA3A08|nr:GNAT family N-acetyltransferase [Tsuneonella amylolytica]